MSTKVSIKWRARTADQPGFHLYDDALDSFGREHEEMDAPVYLHLDGVEAELQTISGGGVSMTVTLPRELARALGLLPQWESPEQDDAS